MILDNVANDGEAQPGAAARSASSLVHPIEAFEDPGLVTCCNTDSVVLDLNHGRVILPESANRNGQDRFSSFCAGVRDGVLDQIGDRRHEPAVVRQDLHRFTLRLDGNAKRLGGQLGLADGIVDDLSNVDDAAHTLVLLDQREVQDVFYQPCHSAGFRLDTFAQ